MQSLALQVEAEHVRHLLGRLAPGPGVGHGQGEANAGRRVDQVAFLGRQQGVGRRGQGVVARGHRGRHAGGRGRGGGALQVGGDEEPGCRPPVVAAASGGGQSQYGRQRRGRESRARIVLPFSSCRLDGGLPARGSADHGGEAGPGRPLQLVQGAGGGVLVWAPPFEAGCAGGSAPRSTGRRTPRPPPPAPPAPTTGPFPPTTGSPLPGGAPRPLAPKASAERMRANCSARAARSFSGKPEQWPMKCRRPASS